MVNITDNAESARIILMGLNREVNSAVRPFFKGSPINLLTAIIPKYQEGEFCILPHVVELMQVEYN